MGSIEYNSNTCQVLKAELHLNTVVLLAKGFCLPLTDWTRVSHKKIMVEYGSYYALKMSEVFSLFIRICFGTAILGMRVSFYFCYCNWISVNCNIPLGGQNHPCCA